MILGHLSTELAAALPREVVDALGLLPGDALAWEIGADGVRISRAGDDAPDGLPATATLRALIREALDDPRPPVPAAEVFAAFTEWASDEDARAFDGL